MLAGREAEHKQIEDLLKSALKKNADPLSIYIGGTPGTGKTATVRLIIDKLRKSRQKFDFVSVDCFDCSTAGDLYRRILEQLGECSTTTTNRLATHLKNTFSNARKPIIILLDEIDRLSGSKTDALIYSAFGWPDTSQGKAIIIGISNTLDLVERMLPKLKTNLHPPKVVTFSPYSKQQLIKILEKKMENDGVDGMAIELCARKVSAITGDVRHAFHIANSVLDSMNEEAENVEPKYLETPSSASRSSASTVTEKALKRTLEACPTDITPGPTSLKTKKNACREVLKEIDKVYASPLLRAQLPLHPRILLATFMRLISQPSNVGGKRAANKTVAMRDKLFDAYVKVCTSLSYSALSSEEIGSAFSLLESQGVISQKPKGRIAFDVEFEIARRVVNDNAILSAIERVEL